MGLFGGVGSKISKYVKEKVLTTSVATVVLPEAALYTKAGRNSTVGQAEISLAKPYLSSYTGGLSDTLITAVQNHDNPQSPAVFIDPGQQNSNSGGGSGDSGGSFFSSPTRQQVARATPPILYAVAAAALLIAGIIYLKER